MVRNPPTRRDLIFFADRRAILVHEKHGELEIRGDLPAGPIWVWCYGCHSYLPGPPDERYPTRLLSGGARQGSVIVERASIIAIVLSILLIAAVFVCVLWPST